MIDDDPDGVSIRKRRRPEASLHGSQSRFPDTDLVGRPSHRRGGGVRNGLPRQRKRDVPRGRMPGTNGSWPATGDDPSPPAICVLREDLAQEELFEEERLGRPLPRKVFGQYPRDLIKKVMPHLHCNRSEVLHVCSGSLPPGEGIRVDINPAARPDIIADGRRLPFRDGSIAAVMLDPPYTEQYAADLYGCDYPRPSHLLAEAARVVRPCGRIAFVHYIVPMPPPGCRFVRWWGCSMGFGFQVRAVSIWEREQDRLL